MTIQLNTNALRVWAILLNTKALRVWAWHNQARRNVLNQFTTIQVPPSQQPHRPGSVARRTTENMVG